MSPTHLASLARAMFLLPPLLHLAAAPAAAHQAPTRPSAAAPSTARPAATGTIAGRVIDRASAQPILAAQVAVEGRAVGASTDLDGRFRLERVPEGSQVLVVRRLGFAPVRLDSVVVRAGQATVITIAMENAAQRLSAMRVQADPVAPRRSNSDAGLLAARAQAATVTDGISAEQMQKSPDSDAGEAMKRVTGVSVLDDKYIVVRGLNERWSNTLLNGAELPSPEPLRKVVPFDIFPASLLESVVTSKSATPDRPGDFAGGSVEIRTREFPDEFTMQLSVSQSYNTLATFETLPMEPRTLRDWAGFGLSRRRMPAGAPQGFVGAPESYTESLRNVWTPAPRRAQPNLGLAYNVGGQRPVLGQPLGAVFSLTWGSKVEAQPNRLWQLATSSQAPPFQGQVYREASHVIDWGAIANVAYKLGALHKLGWKNLYTRNAESYAGSYLGFDQQRSDAELRGYQVRYVERDFLQSQLSGDHVLPFALGSRVEWKATGGFARRDEPDNRTLRYIRAQGDSAFQLAITTDPAGIRPRFLEDRQWSVQGDWSVPFRLRGHAGSLKAGASRRDKRRDFEAYEYEYFLTPSRRDQIAAISALAPEQVFAPENIGPWFSLVRQAGASQPYRGTELVNAAYGMVDVSPFGWLRLVGGARVEGWHARLALGDSGSLSNYAGPNPILRYNRDVLPSANVQVKLGDRMNLRFAAFRSVGRPDLRELSPDQYVPVGGECPYIGSPELQRSLVGNVDARWEWFPRPGELLAVGAFHKGFADPVVETVGTDNANCRVTYRNADSATVQGVELELRRTLDFLPGALRTLGLSANATWTRSDVDIPPRVGQYPDDLALQGQSPFLLNLGASWSYPPRRLTLSTMFNHFDDRIVRYGIAASTGDGTTQGQLPNVVERGRGVLDAKASVGLPGRLTLSVTGANLANARVRYDVEGTNGFASIPVGQQRLGRTFGASIGRDF